MATRMQEASTGYAGIIVAHGTDTMHYTSAFLSFALRGFPIPIVLTGSQRSSDRASSDAALNLMGAATAIASGIPRGVYIAMHQDEGDETVAIHLGTRARKSHTSSRGAFRTVGGDPAYTIRGGRLHANTSGDFYHDAAYTPSIHVSQKAALIKYHPGFDPAILDRMVDGGCRAIILEGTGLGHIGRSAYDSVRRARKMGVFMGMTSQCIEGRVRMTVYESGRDLLEMGDHPAGGHDPGGCAGQGDVAAGQRPGHRRSRDDRAGSLGGELVDGMAPSPPMEEAGARVGLEIHQQLDTGRKLFCGCSGTAPPGAVEQFTRRLRPVKSEMGRYDPAALFEGSRSMTILYHADANNSCLVEMDEEPPHEVDPASKRAALVVAAALQSRVFEEIYAMRKTVIDGSNTSGFQRTMLVSQGGVLEAGEEERRGAVHLPGRGLGQGAGRERGHQGVRVGPPRHPAGGDRAGAHGRDYPQGGAEGGRTSGKATAEHRHGGQRDRNHKAGCQRLCQGWRRHSGDKGDTAAWTSWRRPSSTRSGARRDWSG